jgi:hypothetical protein
MRRQRMVMAGVALAWAAVWGGAALADPKDYRFEAVQPQVSASPATNVAVRLVHVPSNKPVAGAVLFQPRMEMPMGSMAPMPTTVAPAAPDGKGTYPFVADLSMAGAWTLTVSAKVQGEAATITGAVPFTATKADHGHASH